MPPALVEALVTIGFGALAGGLTNTVAVWMLFHPYEPPRIGGLRLGFLHGAIPKNQGRLADAIGRVVGDRLLTQDDLTRILSSPEFRDAFDRRLEAFLLEILERERGPLREILPAEARQEVDQLLEDASELLAGRLETWIDSEAFEGSVEARVGDFLDRVSEHPVAELLTPARESALVDTVDQWLSVLSEREGFRGAVDDYLDRAIEAFLRDDRTFEEVLPAGLVASFEKALAGYLPLAVKKLGGILEDPEARERLEKTVRDLFQKFLGDLRFHQRLMARILVTEETLDRVLATIQSEGAHRLSEILRDPAMQETMAEKVSDAVLDFLRRPVTTVLGRPGDENVNRARETVAGWVLGAARDPATRDFLIGKLRQGLGKAASGSWGDLLRQLPREQLAGGVVAAARSDPARRAYREALSRVLVGVLDRPIGRPADWLPPGSTARLQRALSEPLWGWLQGQSPHVVKTLDVGRRVQEKVRAYPMEKLEELVRRVTDRELKLIVRLGYVLGAIIGGALVAVDALFTLGG
jgi:uncharacterized membrane protein YheB (UPF0754 family)